MQLYPLVRNYKNINPKNLEIIYVVGDGNCLFRVISIFKYGNEHMHNTIRQNIYNEALKRKPNIPNLIIDTERGKFKIHDYINTIKDIGNYGGDLEISIAYQLYNINIAEYTEVRDIYDNLLSLNFSKYFNDDNDEKKILLLITNYNNNHFKIGFYNNTTIDYNYNLINENQENNNNNNVNKFDISNKNMENEDMLLFNDKYELKDLSNINEILNYYNKTENNEDISETSDIYYYIYFCNKNNKEKGSYS